MAKTMSGVVSARQPEMVSDSGEVVFSITNDGLKRA